jgi:hypothetical protein
MSRANLLRCDEGERRFETKNHAHNAEIDLVSKVSETMMGHSGHIAECAPQGSLGYQSESYFITHHYDMSMPMAKNFGQFLNVSHDRFRIVAAEQQVRQPEGEAIHHHNIIFHGALPNDLRHGQWLFHGVKVLAARLSVLTDALRHLPVARLSGRQKEPSFAEPACQSQGKGTLAGTRAAANENDLPKGHFVLLSISL